MHDHTTVYSLLCSEAINKAIMNAHTPVNSIFIYLVYILTQVYSIFE